MEIGRALSDDLDLLTDALNDPAVDLTETVTRMAADTRAAVPSFLGLSLMVTGGATPLTFTLLETPSAVATSLLLPLLRATDDDAASVSLVLYASRAGAFVDLVADLSWLTGIGSFTLDEHLHPPPDTSALSTLRAESTVNQAIGLLLGTGMTPDAAERHLDALARAAGSDRHAAATELLRGSAAPDERAPSD